MNRTPKTLTFALVTQHAPIQFLSFSFRSMGKTRRQFKLLFLFFFCFDDLPLESIVDINCMKITLFTLHAEASLSVMDDKVLIIGAVGHETTLGLICSWMRKLD